ncbi:MAG: hypothetical protein WC730_01035 [Patescibacteria group bacterium]|jgi:uncharacterized membrane protein
MEFPMIYLLIPFGVVVLATTLFVMFNFFHIAHFGLQGTKSSIVLLVYCFSFVGLLIFITQILGSLSWETNVSLDWLFFSTYLL